MKLKYQILWIEDTKKSIEIKIKRIRKYLEDDYGFVCTDDDIEILNYDEFKEKYVENDSGINLNKFDLMLIDFDLGSEKKRGDELIRLIRKGIYSEILFYSSHYDALQSTLNNHFIDGVFTSNRAELESKIKKLIKVTIKKVQDVNNLRGLIMAEVAELDIIKEDIIKKASKKIPGKAIEKYTLKKVKNSGNSNKNKAQRFIEDIENITFEDLFKKIGFIDSDKKVHTLGEILEKLNIQESINKDEFIESYKSNILSVRNKFAHIKECLGTDENGKSCPVIGDIPFTQEKCIKIRQEIKKYKKLLEEIEKAI